MVYFNKKRIELVHLVGNNSIEYYGIKCGTNIYDANKLGCIYKSNTIIIGTCAFINIEEKLSNWLSKVLRLLYPNKKIVVMGCDVYKNRNKYIKYGYEDIYDINEGLEKTKNIYSTSFKENENKLVIKIEDGCCYKCSYCYINQFRANPLYIKKYDDIYKEIQERIKDYNDKVDIYLVGTEVGIYKDIKYNYDLVDLIDNIYSDFKDRIKKISIYSIDPGLPICKKLIQYMGMHKEYCLSHLNIGIQHINNNILSNMKRRHTSKDIYDIHNLAKKNNITIGWEIMVGFPGETEEQFMELYNAMQKLKPIGNTIFIFDAKENTVAYNMNNQIAYPIKQARFNILCKLNNEIKANYKEDILKECNNYGETYDYQLLFKNKIKLQYDMSNYERIKKIHIDSIENFVYDIHTIKDMYILYFTYDKRYEYELLFSIVFLRLEYNNDIWIKMNDMDQDFIDCIYNLSSHDTIEVTGKLIKMVQK